MIPSAFEYKRASSIDEAIVMLSESKGDGRLLAGGHSLIPLMKFRLSEPAVLIDIGQIAELSGRPTAPAGKPAPRQGKPSGPTLGE